MRGEMLMFDPNSISLGNCYTTFPTPQTYGYNFYFYFNFNFWCYNIERLHHSKNRIMTRPVRKVHKGIKRSLLNIKLLNNIKSKPYGARIRTYIYKWKVFHLKSFRSMIDEALFIIIMYSFSNTYNNRNYLKGN